MSRINFTANMDNVSVEYSSIATKVEVKLEGVDINHLIDEIGIDKVLAAIGDDEIVKYVTDNNIDTTDI